MANTETLRGKCPPPPLPPQALLEDILAESAQLAGTGQLADYIPELGAANPRHLGLCVATPKGVVSAGDAAVLFTVQSISKVFIFTCALTDSGVNVMKKVSVEPTGEAFNAITSLETKNLNRPLNPFINAGAIACLTEARGESSEEKTGRVLSLCRLLSGNPGLAINQAVYQSEKATGSRNRALAWYMQSTGVINCDVEELLDAYFRICAIEMDCADLARIALVYAMGGVDPATGQRYVSEKVARIVRSTMATCGMYDESGTAAMRIGLPCKSGVGGGIMACVPGKMGVAAFGPALNEKGSSAAGFRALELLGERLDLCIY